MSTLEKRVNLLAVALPFAGTIAAIVLLWNSYVGVSDLVAFGVMYLIAGFGVTVGFHRLLTHRAFQTYKPIEYGFAIAGSMSVQGPVIDWVADHRKHHAHADEEGDPHSPHVQFGEGWHHNHHAFPRSAKHGLRWYEPDISGLFIRGLERLHLAWNVVTITPERQRERLAASAGSA